MTEEKTEKKAAKDPTMDRESEHPWHVSINRFTEKLELRKHGWMYEAKYLALEVPRMVRLFGRERRGELPKIHRQCSHSPDEEVVDNYLVCCLGQECRKCPELLALDSAKMPPEEIDRAKAWTCGAHIVSAGGDPALEGYLLTVDDIMFWRGTYESLASQDQEQEEEP